MRTLNDGDQLVTAWCEAARGPGWRNQPIWLLIRERGGKLREECLQPPEWQTSRSSELWALYQVADLVRSKVMVAVSALLREGE